MSEGTFREKLARLLGTGKDLDVSKFKPKGKGTIYTWPEPISGEYVPQGPHWDGPYGNGLGLTKEEIKRNVQDYHERAESREALHRKHPDPPPEQFVNVVIRKKKDK